MKLTAYVKDGHDIDIRPAPLERGWMDAMNQRYAYRCLPLDIANAHGWEILCTSGCSASWNGEAGLEAISIHPDRENRAPAITHFGYGVLTFPLACVFRTDPGYDLVVQGPINRPKDAIAALSGVIETDWSPYGFTMNWRFTRPATSIRFEQGEPYCHIFPVRRGELEAVEPEIRRLSENRDLEQKHESWIASRNRFNAGLKIPGSDAQQRQWQKDYYRGVNPAGEPADIVGHRTRLRLKGFKRQMSEAPKRDVTSATVRK